MASTRNALFYYIPFLSLYWLFNTLIFFWPITPICLLDLQFSQRFSDYSGLSKYTYYSGLTVNPMVIGWFGGLDKSAEDYRSRSTCAVIIIQRFWTKLFGIQISLSSVAVHTVLTQNNSQNFGARSFLIRWS